MNNSNIKLHKYQTDILSKLVNAKKLRFNDMLIEGLASEHMNYHLKQLIEFRLVKKTGNAYTLTNAGKDYTNLMDDDVKAIEKQPKTSIILHVVRKNENNEVEHLLSKRLRQPYLGKIGRLTGKVKFGETTKQAAERELYEETGLKAKTLTLENIYNSIKYSESGECIQDIIFYIFFTNDTYGDFIEKTRHQENFWLTTNEMKKKEKYDFFADLSTSDRLEPKHLTFDEAISVAKDY